jgi:hypothetical protein
MFQNETSVACRLGGDSVQELVIIALASIVGRRDAHNNKGTGQQYLSDQQEQCQGDSNHKVGTASVEFHYHAGRWVRAIFLTVLASMRNRRNIRWN